MWADNETATDLLGFSVHKDVIKQLVLTENLLPLTIGVFGDWGSGKSSVMRMLQQDLEKEHEDIACLYFNGWVFEGYDDAKAALLSSILIQLGEHRTAGPKIRKGVISLLKKVDKMRVIKLGASLIPSFLIQVGAAHGIIDPQQAAAIAPMLAAGLTQSPPASATATTAEDKKDGESEEEHIDWTSLIAKDSSAPGILDIRTFRKDFEKLVAETKLRAVVVLIDDLDRCDPDRLIENLEAIKLFLAVPHTAFIIAADQRIIRYAIAKRYQAPQITAEQAPREDKFDLVKDYLEKLIQIPYTLPRLSPSEMESYMTLLFCQMHLSDGGKFEKINTACNSARRRSLYLTFNLVSVKEALQEELPPPLVESLQWISSIAPALTEGLKGNPRQVKRFLNTLLLRKQLAMAASLDIKDAVLVKLMILEYIRPELFDQLYEWQANSEGHPQQLKVLEERASEISKESEAQNGAESKSSIGKSTTPLIGWSDSPVQALLRLDPPLSEIDLRDYFWISRDRLTTMISGLTMVPTFIRRLINLLISPNPGERKLAVKEVMTLAQEDLAMLLRLLGQNLQRKPEEEGSFAGLISLIDADVTGASDTLLAILRVLPDQSIPSDFAYELQRIAVEKHHLTDQFRQILQNWSTTQTKAGVAARAALEELKKPAK